MKKIVKWILAVLIAIGAVAGGVYYSGLPMAVSAVQAVPKNAELYFTEQGIADVDRTVEVYAGMPGKIESLSVSENQEVQAGDVLCVIDSADLVHQIAQAESGIKGYQAQMDNLDTEESKAKDSLTSSKNSLLGELRALEAQENTSSTTTADQLQQQQEQIRLQGIVITQNENDLARAKADMEKMEVLYKAGGLSLHEYNQAVSAVEMQESLLAQNRQQLQIIESGEILGSEDYYTGAKESLLAQIAGIDATLGKSYAGAMKGYYAALIEGGRATIAQLNQKIEDSTIKAPVSGIITSLPIKDTNMVNMQTPIAAITPDLTNHIEVYVATSDIDEVSVGQAVELILKRRSGDKSYEGVVKDIDSEATVKLSVLGVEERRVKVTVAPVTGVDEIKKGFDVDVKFVIYHEENKLTVPKTAIFVVDDKDMLWVIRPEGDPEGSAAQGRAVMAEIQKGRELRTEFIVDGGLNAGDWVITDADTSGLKEGANVKSE